MTTLSFSREADFSNRAHAAMARDVYPLWFPRNEIRLVDVTNTIRDLEYAIDRQIELGGVPGLRAPLVLSVQERFRKPHIMKYGDTTITEWNPGYNGGSPSELYKLHAHMFVYGFYDDSAGRILRATAFNVLRVVRGIASGKLRWERRINDRGQDYIAIPAAELRDIGAVDCSYWIDSNGLARVWLAGSPSAPTGPSLAARAIDS